MGHIEFSMKQGQSLVTLAKIIALVDPGEWTWRLFEFSGIGIAPRDMTMPEFEAAVLANGYSMNWPELQQFAANVEQTWDCLIVALSAGDQRSRKEIIDSKYAQAAFVIEGIDSTDWGIRSNDPARLQKIADLLGVPSVQKR